MWFSMQLCFDLIKEWMVKNQQASICTHEGVQKFMDIANYQDYHGLPEFRQVSYLNLNKLLSKS